MKTVQKILAESFDSLPIINKQCSNKDFLVKTDSNSAEWISPSEFYARFKSGDLNSRLFDEFKWHIPPKFILADLDDIQIDLRNYCLEDGFKNGGLYLSGTPGVGKTHAAFAMYKTFIANKVDVRYYNVPNMIQELKDDFGVSHEGPFLSYSENLFRLYKVLIIDDLGAEKTDRLGL